MNLVKGAWKLLVGIKDGLVLLFMLLFFGAIWAGLSSRPGGGAIGTGALVLKLNGAIVEQPTITSPTALIGGRRPGRQFRLRDLVQAIKSAATDDRVKAVVLDLDGFAGGGAVSLNDVGAALDLVRAAKKPVFAYAVGYTDDGYALAAHASQVWLDPMGLALFAGPGGTRLYYKGLIDRLGVNAHVYRVGKYKSAVEPYSRAESSPEAKEEDQVLSAALWQGWQAAVVKARPKARIAAYTADPVAATAGGDMGRAALDAGIVDKLGDRAAFGRAVAAVAGDGRDGAAFAAIALSPWIAAHPVPAGAGDIAIVTVAGVISDGEAGPGGAGGDIIARQIDKAVASDRFKAIVVRVDSPGGSALASEKIRAALAAAKARGLPIVISMGNVAASGGYWIAMAGDRVFAEPATITGSIGIFGVIPTFEAVLKKAGITTDGVRTTPLSGQPDIFGGTSAAFDTIIQRSVENGYDRFIMLVANARKLSPDRVNEIAQGRVWDGGSARQINLIDAFGGIDDAIAEAARRAKLDPATDHAVWIEKEPGLLDRIAATFAGTDSDDEGMADEGMANDVFSVLARQRLSLVDQAIDDVQQLATGAAIQARCIQCAAPPAATPPRVSLKMMLFRWMTQ
jgi:protease IV